MCTTARGQPALASLLPTTAPSVSEPLPALLHTAPPYPALSHACASAAKACSLHRDVPCVARAAICSAQYPCTGTRAAACYCPWRARPRPALPCRTQDTRIDRVGTALRISQGVIAVYVLVIIARTDLQVWVNEHADVKDKCALYARTDAYGVAMAASWGRGWSRREAGSCRRERG